MEMKIGYAKIVQEIVSNAVVQVILIALNAMMKNF
jgi:hypothetical protein